MIGGDRSAAVPAILAQNKNYESLNVIWIDAHADLKTYETSIAGETYGMAVSFLTGIDTPTWAAKENLKLVPFEKVTFVGLRN